VPIYQVGEDRGVPFIAMPFLKGESLHDRLKREPALPIAEVVRIGRETARGLAAAHAQGLVHRDIKPANLWLEGAEGKVKILDFGLAKAASDAVHLTQSGVILGTPAYMAPEQAGGQVPDPRSDLFSLGCILYEACTGERPFQGPDLLAILAAQALHQPAAPKEVRPEVPRALSDLVLQLLAKKPADRPASAQAVAETLERVAREPAEPSAPGSGLRRPPEERAAVRDPGSASTLKKTGKGKHGRKRLQSPAWWQRPGPLAGVAAAFLALSVGIWLLAGVIFKTRVRTVEGEAYVVLEVDQPGAEVRVDGDRFTVSVPGDNKPIEIKVAPGRHQLQISKDGFMAVTQNIELRTGQAEPIKVRLEPIPVAPARPVAAAKPDEQPLGPLPAAEGFVPLFNGKDLTGWKTHPSQPGNWRVENGVLIGAGPSVSHLYTERGDYQDFHLRMEARINENGNTGVYFRAPFGPSLPMTGQPTWVRGYNAKLVKNRIGSLLIDDEPPARLSETSVKPGEWVTLEVTAEGNHLTIKANGKITAEFTDEKQRYTKGHIVLQQHGPATVTEFRRIEIKELPPVQLPAAPAIIAAPQPDKSLDQSLTPLFNGRDLTGWEGLPGYWHVENGAIVGRCPPGQRAHTFLISKKTYRDFDLRFQVRRQDGFGNSGVQFRSQVKDRNRFTVVGPQCEIDSASFQYPPGSLLTEPNLTPLREKARPAVIGVYKDADFNAFHIRCVGKHVTIEVNAVTAVDGDFPSLPEEGVIAWQIHGGKTPRELTFRNIEFTDLSGAADPGGAFVPLFNGRDLTGWKVYPSGTGAWKVEGGLLVGRGPLSHLFTERGDYTNFHFRVEAMINDGGNSGQYFRAQFGPGFIKGYEAQIDSTHRDPIKTGSLYPAFDLQLSPSDRQKITILQQLHRPLEWFTQEVIARDNHVVIKVNGQTTVDFVDQKNTYRQGHLALQQHDPATVVKFRKVEVKELP
jgi:hypothetical protein